jgi:hypothetical protein
MSVRLAKQRQYALPLPAPLVPAGFSDFLPRFIIIVTVITLSAVVCMVKGYI